MTDLEEDQYMDWAAGGRRRPGIGGTDGRKIEMPAFYRRPLALNFPFPVVLTA
jgi:hypothetical protein